MKEELENKRPFDFLNKHIGKKIVIDLNDGARKSGILISFDIHLNLVITEMQQQEDMLIRGGAISCIRKGN